MHNYIKIFKQIIPEDICSNIIKELEFENKWEMHGYHDNSNNQVSDFQDEFSVSYAIPHSAQMLNNITDSCIFEYISELPEKEKFTVSSISGIRYNKYSAGTLMRTHVDHIHTLFNKFGGVGGIPALTVLYHLNDNYLGGEFVIRDVPHKLGTGDVIVFPSNFLFPHSVETIQEGNRYSAVSWVV